MTQHHFRMFCGSLVLLVLALPALAQKPSHAQLASEIADLRQQISDREKAFLAPDAEDLAKYAVYAQSSDTGVIRIMPREKYGNVLSIREGGAYYSFATRSNEYGRGNDLGLEQGMFSVGFAGADFGFLKMLGDVSLETVTLDSEAIQPLDAYTPPSNEPGARIEQAKFRVVVSKVRDPFSVDRVPVTVRQTVTVRNDGDPFYVNRAPAKVGQTYAVRSIVYDRTDILAAFRVVRQDEDGSLIVVWKLLKRYDQPRLRMAQKTQASNLSK